MPTLCADTKQKHKLGKRGKILAKLYNQLFILKTNIFESQNGNKLSTKKLKTSLGSCFRSQLDPSMVSFDVKCSCL